MILTFAIILQRAHTIPVYCVLQEIKNCVFFKKEIYEQPGPISPLYFKFIDLTWLILAYEIIEKLPITQWEFFAVHKMVRIPYILHTT